MLRRFLCVLSLLTVGGLVRAESAAQPLASLLAMRDAMQALNYQGTVAILKNAKLDTLQYFHAVQDGVEQERLLSLNSPVREVIRDNGKVSCLFKASQQVVVDHKPVGKSFILEFPKTPAELTKSYDLVMQDEAQVALQAAEVLLAKPLDQYRYARKFWIAKQTHLPLKVEVQDFTGETLEQVIFTDLQVVEQLPKANIALSDKKVSHIHQFEDLGLAQVPFELRNLPAGFEKRLFTRTHLHPSNKAVQQLLLSDGLSSVSIYLEQDPHSFHTGLQTAGAVNSLSRIDGDRAITVMGDVPVATLEFIMDGIIFPNSVH